MYYKLYSIIIQYDRTYSKASLFRTGEIRRLTSLSIFALTTISFLETFFLIF